MKKKINTSALLLSLLILAIAAVFIVYNFFYSPNEKKYESYLNVFEEIDQTVTRISISSINHNVVIKKSSDSKIRIGYYQKLDNTNVYQTVNGVLSLIINEECEDINNLFFKSENPINNITLYVPANDSLIIDVQSVYGGIQCEETQLKKLSFSTLTGEAVLTEMSCSELLIDTNSGPTTIRSVAYDRMDISSVSGKINLRYDDSIQKYGFDISTTYGSIKLNNELLMTDNESGGKVKATQYQTALANKPMTTVRSTRSVITLQSVEVVEEPQETIEPQETPAAENE